MPGFIGDTAGETCMHLPEIISINAGKQPESPRAGQDAMVKIAAEKAMVAMGGRIGGGAVVLAMLAAGSTALAGTAKCARPDEVTAIQAATIQQELMVAALTCNDITRFNAFQTGYGRELRSSDGALERMFKRLYGSRQGESEYHGFKTRLANNSSIRSIHGNSDFCREAAQVFDAALGPERPGLADFVSGIEVFEQSPIDSCQLRVAVGLAGAKSVPNVVPKPNPMRLAALAAPSEAPSAPQPPSAPPASATNN